jgi:hypothetical protein
VQIGTVMQQLGTTYKKKEDEHNEFRNKWNIQVRAEFKRRGGDGG